MVCGIFATFERGRRASLLVFLLKLESPKVAIASSELGGVAKHESAFEISYQPGCACVCCRREWPCLCRWDRFDSAGHSEAGAASGRADPAASRKQHQ